MNSTTPTSARPEPKKRKYRRMCRKDDHRLLESQGIRRCPSCGGPTREQDLPQDV